MPLVFERRRAAWCIAAALAAALAPLAAWAAEADWLGPQRPLLAARYEVQQLPSGASQTWYFYRLDDSIHLIKPGLEEVWRRADRGQLSFERYFLADRRSVHYSMGELRTLGVQAQWESLQTLIDPQDLRGLPSATPLADGQWRLSSETLDVLWDAPLQLPRLIERRWAAGTVRWRLVAHGPSPQTGWPIPDAGGQTVDRLDAADLGDMAYDPFARKAELLDLRMGWRHEHGH